MTAYIEWLDTRVHGILFRFQVYEKVGISLGKGREIGYFQEGLKGPTDAFYGCA